MSRLWVSARDLKSGLIADGWSCADSYAKHFSPITDESAVYLILLYHTDDFSKTLLAYVGMSTNLKARMNAHEIITELWHGYYWPCRWFKPTPVDDLRAVEKSYIEKFDPPWNIQGKRRGVDLP